jgi:hypothetical protein
MCVVESAAACEARVAANRAIARGVGRVKPHLAKLRGRWKLLFNGVTSGEDFARASEWLRSQNGAAS